MRRVELVRGVVNVQRALDSSQLAMRLAPGADDATRQALLTAFQDYSGYAKDFNAVERNIVRMVHLDNIASPEVWGALLHPNQDHANNRRMEIKRLVDSASEALQILTDLVITEGVAAEFRQESSDDTLGDDDSEGLLTLILFRQDNVHDRPERIVDALEGVSALYTAFAVINQLPSNTLRVIACDSGSPMTFILAGVAAAITPIKKLVPDIWRRWQYSRQTGTEKDISNIVTSLDAFAKINDLERANRIRPEEATLARKGLNTGIEKIVATRATTNDVVAVVIEPQALPAPEQQKLLVEGSQSENNQ